MSQMVTITRGRFGSTASRVLEQVRGSGLTTREELVQATGLSFATVARTVGSLTEAGLVRERADKARSGARGRPSVPVEVDRDHYVTAGVHLGRRVVTVAVGDLTGQVIVSREVPHAEGTAPDLDAIGRVVADLLGDLPGRAPLSAGIVAPWRELPLDADETAGALHEVLGLDVASADHVAAVAATEFLHRRHGTGGVTLYVYARDTVGYAVAVDKGVQTEVSRVGSLTHFPTGSPIACACGHTGCLEATVGDHSLAERAASDGVIGEASVTELYVAAAAGDDSAHGLLLDRARTLGRVAAVVRDMVTPDRVILVGQGFTSYRDALPEVVDAFAEATALPDLTPTFTRFGDGIQAVTACTIALGPVYDDPVSLVPSRVALRRDQAGR